MLRKVRTTLRSSVRATLILLSLLILLPISVTRAAEMYRRVDDYTNRELRASLELAGAVGIAFQNYVQTLWNMELVVGNVFVQEGLQSPGSARAEMTHFAAVHPPIRAMAWLKPDGRVAVASSEDIAFMDQSVVVQAVLGGQDAVISDLYQMPVTGRAVFSVARAIRREGRLEGIVVAILDSGALGQVLPIQRMGKGVIAVSDRKGVLAYSSASSEIAWSTRVNPTTSVREALRTGQPALNRGTVTRPDFVERMGAVVPITGLGWVVAAGYPVSEVMAPLWTEVVNSAVIWLLAAVSAVLAALLIARHLERPLLSLRDAAVRLAEGDLSARAEIPGVDMIDHTAGAFNAMAERVQAAEERLRSEGEHHSLERKRLRAVLETAPVGIYIADAQGSLLEANQAGRAVWGNPVDWPDHAIRPGYFLTWWAASGERTTVGSWGLAKVLRTGEPAGPDEIVLQGLDGIRRTIVNMARPIRDETGALVNVVAVNIDITDRKRVEVALRQAHQDLERRVEERTEQLQVANRALRDASRRLQAIFDHSFQLMALIRPNGRVLVLNETARRFGGHQDESLSDKAFWALPWWAGAPAVQGRLRTATEQAAAGELVRLEVEVVRAGGEKVVLDFSLLPVRDDDGSVAVLLAEGRDITDLKRAQAVLRERDAAEQRERARTRFLQIAAHELRNPMAGVKGIISLLERRVAGGRPLGDQTATLGVLQREVDHLTMLLNEMLDAFRAQEGQLGLRRQRINLSECVVAAIRPLQALAEEHDFRLELPDDPVWVLGDKHRLEEVLRNLLSNAMKYSPGGGRIGVRVESHARTGNAQVQVSDRGIGIPADQLDKVFEGFFRANNLTRHDPGGLGLGLYICKEIVESHGGKIWVESREGVGSTFMIWLPLLDEDEGAQGEELL